MSASTRMSQVASRVSLIALALAVTLLGAAWLANWKLDMIATGSMAPTAPTNSLAVVSPVSAQDVQRLDVIAFHDPQTAKEIVHRVVKVVHAPGGQLFFQTQGDANATPDERLVSSTRVIGRMRWDIPKIGGLVGGLRPPLGYVVLIPPLLYFVLGELSDQRKKRVMAPATH